MAERKTKSKSMSRTRILILVIILFLLVAILVVVKNIVDLRIEQNRLTAQEQELQTKKDELNAELQGVDDLDYIEEQARKLLKMIKPGEVLFILNGSDPRPEGANSDDENSVIPAPEGVAPQQPTTEEVVQETTEQVYQEEEQVETEYTDETTETEYTEEQTEPEYTEETWEEGTTEETTSEEYTEETSSEETGYEG